MTISRSVKSRLLVLWCYDHFLSSMWFLAAKCFIFWASWLEFKLMACFVGWISHINKLEYCLLCCLVMSRTANQTCTIGAWINISCVIFRKMSGEEGNGNAKFAVFVEDNRIQYDTNSLPQLQLFRHGEFIICIFIELWCLVWIYGFSWFWIPNCWWSFCKGTLWF